MRSLSPEEAELWAKVAATIRPLSANRELLQSAEIEQKAHRAPAPARFIRNRNSTALPKRSTIGEESLDGSWDKKLRSGSIVPDRTVDLHGMNLHTAWTAIDRALDQAVARGDRILLLITGHDRSGDPPVQRGKIRAAVRDWLAASRHADEIAAVRPAHRRHGGGGSLYLVFRRRRSPR